MHLKAIPILLFLTSFFSASYAKSQTLIEVTPLHNTLMESSGLIEVNARLVTHNDSGGQAVLYEIDTISGEPSRIVEITNAMNIDWEDICADDEHIYVGDIGNNQGSRTDLKIYKIALSDFIGTANDEVTAEIISFNYADQDDFTPSEFTTNFDAEAIIAHGDQLHIFTKNWGDQWTNIYSVPKTPGNYSISKMDSINIEGMITGAVYNSPNDKIILTGYSFLLSTFLVQLTGFSDGPPSQGEITKIDLQIPAGFSSQIEAITTLDNNTYYLSSEQSFTGNSGLFRIELDEHLDIENHEKPHSLVYPNPSSDTITIENQRATSVEIYNPNGNLVLKSDSRSFSVSTLPGGVYSIKIFDKADKILGVEKLIVSD